MIVEEATVIALKTRRCFECGRWWSYETFAVAEAECPVCARRRIQSLESTIASNQKSIAALRGALKRRKAKR